MGVLRPLRVVIENYPEDRTEEVDVVNNPEDAAAGTRKVPFSRVLYIEQDDFREDPPKKFFRLAPGREVRLRCAYFITCTGVVKDPATGEVIELRCTYDPATRGGDAPDGRKVKATLHWVSAAHAVDAEVRLYDRLFKSEEPGKTGDYPRRPEPGLAGSRGRREGRAVRRRRGRPGPASSSSGSATSAWIADSAARRPVFNRTVTLKDSWAKMEQKQPLKPQATGSHGSLERRPSGAASVELAGGDLLHQLVERCDPRAVRVGPEVRLVEQHAAQARGARAHHVDVIQVPDVDRRVASRRRSSSSAISKNRGSGFSTPSSAESSTTSKRGVRPSRSRCARSVPLAFETTTIRRPRCAQRLRSRGSTESGTYSQRLLAV